MNSNKKFTFGALLIVLILGIAALSHEIWLYKIAETLVHQDPMEPVDAIIVLSGSNTGNRINAGVSLLKKGFGKAIIMSGPEYYPGLYLSTLMKNHAVRAGAPEDKVIARKLNKEVSTWGEGIENLKAMRENSFKSFILVTSAFHSKRAHNVYKKLMSEKGYDLKMLVYPATDSRVPIQGWWRSRTGKKGILIEYLSTINYMLEH